MWSCFCSSKNDGAQSWSTLTVKSVICDRTKCMMWKGWLLIVVMMINMLKDYTVKHTNLLPRPQMLFHFFFPYVPSAPSCFFQNVRAHGLMSLARLTDISLERNPNSCNMVMRGKNRYWECAPLTLSQSEWKNGVREKGIPLLLKPLPFRVITKEFWLLLESAWL